MPSETTVLATNLLVNAQHTANGTWDLWTSGKQSVASPDAMELTVEYKNPIPYSDNDESPPGANNVTPNPTQYALSAILEEEVESGVWVPFHAQGYEFRNTRNGSVHRLVVDPRRFLLEPVNIIQAGEHVLFVESAKQMTLPDNFRVRIELQETGFGTPGQLSSVTISASYREFTT